MIVVIDDERTFADEVDHYARTSNEGLALIAHHWSDFVLHYANPIQELWLDHDLSDDDIITPVVDYLYVMGSMDSKPELVSFKSMIHNIYVHSQNPTVDWIVDLLSPLYLNVRRVPLPELV